MPPNVVIIANPHAGGGRARKSAQEADHLFTNLGIRSTLHLRPTLPEMHNVIERIAAESPSVVLACGGDGTIHQVLQATIPAKITTGIIPAGTGNDIARNMGLPTSTSESYLVEVASLINQDHYDWVDASLITHGSATHWSLGVISAGFDSAVNERANRMKYGRGTLRYISALLAEIVPFQLHSFTVEMDGDTYNDPALLIAIGNGRGYGGGMRICPEASMTDGLLNVTWVGKAQRRTVLRLFPRIYSGRHIEHDLVTTYTVKEVRITSQESVIYADGERIGPPPVHITLVPRAAKILWKIDS